MGKLVYLLSDYGEYGSQHVIATFDKSKVERLLEKHFKGYDLDGPQYSSGHPTMREKLHQLLKDGVDGDVDEKGDGVDLGEGWGGVQLHIVELSD